MPDNIFDEKVSGVYVEFFSLAQSHPLTQEGAGFMNYTATRHQGAIKMFAFTY